MGHIRKQGFELQPGMFLLLTRTANGEWSAWIERNNVPLRTSEGQPRLFTASTAYQAQCAATQWLRRQGLLESQIQPLVLVGTR